MRRELFQKRLGWRFGLTRGENVVENISVTEVRDIIDSDEDIAIIDVLPEDSYRNQHLPRAINIPFESDDFETRVKEELPDEGIKIVTYCTDEDCDLSPQAAKKLEEMGYVNVNEFKAGLKGWVEAGNQIEGEQAKKKVKAATSGKDEPERRTEELERGGPRGPEPKTREPRPKERQP